jgi:hypothetical protein
VKHALDTTEYLAQYLNGLSGSNIVAAHSLGNMLVLGALNPPKTDLGSPGFAPANISQVFSLDAAVAAEAIDGDIQTRPIMAHSDWDTNIMESEQEKIPEWLWTSEWHQLFAAGDYRRNLTWRNRLAGSNGAAIYNFYSSGEEVLDFSGVKPTGTLINAATEILGITNGPMGTNAWYYQELFKGRHLIDGLIGSSYGGWGFGSKAMVSYLEEEPYVGTVVKYRRPTINEVNGMNLTVELQKTQPLFLANNAKELEQENIMELCGVNGSNFAFRHYNQLLAEMVPVRTIAMGKAPINKLNEDSPSIEGGNYDLTLGNFKNGWPQERLDDVWRNIKWLHSDAREVAYLYTYKLFDKWIELGELDEK